MLVSSREQLFEERNYQMTNRKPNRETMHLEREVGHTFKDFEKEYLLI